MLQRQSLLPRVLVEVQKMSNKHNGQRWILVLLGFVLLIFFLVLFLTRTELGQAFLRGPVKVCSEMADKTCGDAGIAHVEFRGSWVSFSCEFICKE